MNIDPIDGTCVNPIQIGVRVASLPVSTVADPVKEIIESISPQEWQSICNHYSTQRELFENPAWEQTKKDLKGIGQSDQQKDWSVYLYSQKLYENTGKHGAGDKVCVFVFDESKFNRSFNSSEPPSLGTLYSAKDSSFIRVTWRGIDFSNNPLVKVLTDDIELLTSGQNTVCINGFSFPIERLDETSNRALLQDSNLINHSAPARFFQSTISRGRLESKAEYSQNIKITIDILKAHESKIIRLNGLDQSRFFRELEAELNKRISKGELNSTATTDVLKQWLNGLV